MNLSLHGHLYEALKNNKQKRKNANGLNNSWRFISCNPGTTASRFMKQQMKKKSEYHKKNGDEIFLTHTCKINDWMWAIADYWGMLQHHNVRDGK